MNGKGREFLSRRFVLALLSLAGGVYITITQDADKVYAFAALTGVIVGFYTGGNTAEAIATIKAAKSPPKEE